MKKLLAYKTLQPLLLLFVLIMASGTLRAQTSSENRLTIPDFTAGINKTVSVPIHLSNTDDVIAAQFDITLPFSMPTDGLPVLSNRSDQHTVSLHALATAANAYRVVIMSTENHSLRGNAGLLLRLPMAAQDRGSLKYTVQISNVVLTDKKGHNIASNSTATGTYTVSRENLPDLTVSNVTLAPATLKPGDKVTIGFTANNTGGGATRAGWTEKFYLESTNGSRCYIGSKAFTGTLAANASEQRSQQLTIPSTPHIDGQVKAVVELVPNANTGELSVDTWNNIGTSATTAQLGKLLMLSYNKNTVREGVYINRYSTTYDYITMTLTRSGDWTLAETFQLSCNVQNLLTCNGAYLPANVTIPAGKGAVTFRISSVNDNIVRAKEATLTIGAAHGYQSASCRVFRVDNDRNPLSLTTSLAEMHEGQELTISATRGGELTDALHLELGCSAPYRFTSPLVIELPAGKATGKITVKALSDGLPQLDGNVRFTASATDYQSASATVRLLDDDRPALDLVVTPSVVCENGGQNASTAIVSRDRGLEQAVRVRLTSSRSEVLPEKNLVVIPAGEKSVEVSLSVTDNSAVDAQRTPQLTAQLFVEGNNAYAPTGDRACQTALLTVTDDESPYLELTSRVNTLGEGATAVVTLQRYVATPTGSLIVSLSSSDEGVTVPTSVTIPSGSYQTTFNIQVKKNIIEGDDRIVTLAADAMSINPAELMLRISDRTLPDAVGVNVDYDDEQFYSGMPATIYVEVANEGTAVLPAGMKIDFYLATGSTLGRYVKSIPFTTVYTEQELAIGEVQRLKFTADVPQVVGNYWLYARLNADDRLQEFTNGNNLTRLFKRVYVAAPFSVDDITVDRESYLPGELVTVSGRVTGRLNGQTVRVSLVGTGQRTFSDTSISDDGYFKTQVLVDRSAAGIMSVQALALGQTEAAKTVDINVWNMQLTADNSTWLLNENYPRTGRLTLRNTSGRAVSGITLSHTTLPDGCHLTVGNVPQTLAAGAAVNIDYTVNPTLSMTGSYLRFTLTAKCEEGVSVDLPINYLCKATNGNISLSPASIGTTLLLNSTRQIGVKVTNYGLKATGLITLNVPGDVAWLRSLSGSSLPSLEPGASTTLYLQLTHQKGMHSGQRFATSVQLSPESGASRLLPVTVTVTGTEYAQLDIQTNDVFSLSDKGFDHVSGADVRILNTRGQTVISGNVGTDGSWRTDRLTQGTYQVEIAAPRHRTVRKQIVIGPDEQLKLDVYLPYRAVVAEFISGINDVTGEYELTSQIDVDYSAPQAIVVPTLPSADDFRCETATFDMKLTNVGSRPALMSQITLPAIPGATLTMHDNLPAVLYPKESFVVTVSYDNADEGRHRYIATMPVYYAFSIDGTNYSEEDKYQMLTGCDGGRGDVPVAIPEPETTDTSDNHENPETTKNALPTYNSYFELVFDTVDDVMTGEPLNAVLKVKNGQIGTLDHLMFIPQICGYETYEDSTEVFTVNEGEFTGFTRTADGYVLSGNNEGTIHLQFIPKPEAAVDGPRTYWIGGQLAYISQSNAIRSAASLVPVKIVVKPQGSLALIYFVQRNFLGDDVDTKTVEATVPAEMALMVRNDGSLPLASVTVESTQPQVVANDDLRPLAYSTLNSEMVVGGDKQSPTDQTFTKLTVDNLQPGVAATGRWTYGSNESGHVSELTVETDCQSAATITVEGVKELVRTVNNGEGDVFLVNDIDDEYGSPDVAWPLDGTEPADVADVTAKTTMSGTSGTYTLRLSGVAKGWGYGRLHDPTNGRMLLTKVVRQSDGREMSLANFWQTDRSVERDNTVIYENLLHFADSLRATNETYTLTFEERDGELPQVMNIRLYRADGVEVTNGSTTTQPVTKAVVEFTRPMRALYYQYFTLSVGDYAYSSADTKITKQDDGATYVIDMSSLEQIPGNHRMEVFAEGLKDLDRVAGVGSLAVDWTENLIGKARLELAVGPDDEAGTIDHETADFNYGKVSLTATAADGYRFVGWTANGTAIAETPTLEYDVTGAASLRALFVPVDCQVMVDCEADKGVITGFASGSYAWGNVLLLSAVGATGYVFDYWLCDGERVSSESALRAKVDGSHTYTAVFAEEVVGIREATTTATATDSRWYSLQGICLGEKMPVRPGLYIHCGKTVRVK